MTLRYYFVITDIGPITLIGMFRIVGGSTERYVVLETIAIILVILWLLGILSSYAVGGFIHLLLVLAVIVVLVRLFGGGPKPPV